MTPEPLITWPEPITNLVEYLGAFAAAGAIGFRYAVLPERAAPADADVALYASARRRAALIGLGGIIVGAILFATSLPEVAARRHTTLAGVLTGSPPSGVGALMLLAALVGFLLVLGGRRGGWYLAAVGVIVFALRSGFSGRWTQLINPVHILAGGLWIGTLFVLLAAGLPAALAMGDRAHRGAAAAGMVNRFSPLALCAGSTLVLFGVITAWRHLKRLDALWTTPYGWTLIGKLCVVAVVFGLGAWNWRRQRPLLGAELAALAIRRSARAELAFAGVVLIITSFLVALPAPR
jgi:putative copper export protein